MLIRTVPMLDRLFVYGSLQPGGDNAHILSDLSGHWEPGVVHGTLMSEGWGADLGYPGIVLDDNGPRVAGFVFSSVELGTAWKMLDEFEGQEYERQSVSVELQSGGRVMANIYALRSV